MQHLIVIAAILISAGAVWSETVPQNMARQWTIKDDGRYVDAENSVLHLKFARNAQKTDGWFKGGGGQDGGIVELYYKPTSTTRNLVFRNGAWGGKMDAMDYWEAEDAAKDGADHNAPDFATSTDAEVDTFTVNESAGRLIVECSFRFKSWYIKRTYIIYPWGDMTVSADIRLTEDSRWNYLGHRFHFGVSNYVIANHRSERWGANYQDDSEYYYAWSDIYGPDGKYRDSEPYVYRERIAAHRDINTAIHMAKRYDPYSGFMIDDSNGNDPDIIVMNGDKATWLSPFEKIARAIGGHSYIESGMYTPPWAPAGATHADMCWFYGTVVPPAYSDPMLWKKDLGEWRESFHVLFRQGLTSDDYLPLWRAKAREPEKSAPYDVTGGRVAFNDVDRLYHVIADTMASEVRFLWKDNTGLPANIGYRSAIVFENMNGSGVIDIAGCDTPGIEVFADEGAGAIVLVRTEKADGKELAISVKQIGRLTDH